MKKSLAVGIGIAIVIGIAVIGISSFSSEITETNSSDTGIVTENTSEGVTYYANLDESVGTADSSP